MKASISEYLQSRRYNRKLYDRIVEAIQQLDYDAEATIDMSAKSQTPVIRVEGPDNAAAAEEIYGLLGQYFKAFEPEYRDDNTTRVDFLDEY